MDDHDHDHFTLGINSNMELLDNDHTNPSTENFDSSNVNCHELFMPLSGRHQRDDCNLPFMFLPDVTTDDQSFSFGGVHQAESFYDPLTCFPTTTDDTVKIKSGDGRFGNSDRHNEFTGVNKAKRNYGGGGGRKRFRNSETKVEKPREVVHVRARRGEATDSHSLAERMRREKINRKLRSLQELVPGCYKTMGMSVMLEVTINYIRSLQNQIEFLSMKLTAASMFYDFNSAEMDALDSIKGSNGYEAQVMDTMGEDGYGNILQFQSTWI